MSGFERIECPNCKSTSTYYVDERQNRIHCTACKCQSQIIHCVDKPQSTFNTILDEMRTTHDKKSADYAKAEDRFSNFTEAAAEAGCSVDTVFRVLIGIKNARVKQLMNSGAAPKNESLEDSILDRTIYSILWMAWRRENQS